MGLLTGGLIVAVSTPGHARPHPRAEKATLAARLAPPVVTVGEPAALVSKLTPAQADRPLAVQRLTDGAWTPVADTTADGSGRNVLPLDTSAAGPQVLRVVAVPWHGKPQVTSPTVTLKVSSPTACSPKVALVDPEATAAARCLAARLDRWQGAGLMGVGQELNMSTLPYQAPLTALGDRRVSVVGFDLMELGKTKTYEFPFFDQAFSDLVASAQSGAVLTASWHTPNPHTGAADSYNDRSWHQLGAVLQDTPEAAAFWADYDEQLAVLHAFQDAGVAVVFRPLHEANGDWFWWGRPTASTYKAVWREMQQRARDAGVHNVLWAYSFAASSRKGIAAPQTLLPAKVDVAGIDSYWPSTGSHRSQAPSMDGYAEVAKKVRRMAFTEIGPYADKKQVWSAANVTATARAQARPPVWALLWVDDAAGAKQISSLKGGLSWLDSCPFGFCTL